MGPRQFIADQLLAKAGVIRATSVFRCARTHRTEFALHILRVHGHTILQEKRVAAIYHEVGQRSLERLFPGFTEGQFGASYTRRRPVGHGVRGGRGTSLVTAHLGALIPVTARLLPKQPLVTRFAAVVEVVTELYISKSSPGSGRGMAANSSRTQWAHRHQTNSVRD